MTGKFTHVDLDSPGRRELTDRRGSVGCCARGQWQSGTPWDNGTEVRHRAPRGSVRADCARKASGGNAERCSDAGHDKRKSLVEETGAQALRNLGEYRKDSPQRWGAWQNRPGHARENQSGAGSHSNLRHGDRSIAGGSFARNGLTVSSDFGSPGRLSQLNDEHRPIKIKSTRCSSYRLTTRLRTHSLPFSASIFLRCLLRILYICEAFDPDG